VSKSQVSVPSDPILSVTVKQKNTQEMLRLVLHCPWEGRRKEDNESGSLVSSTQWRNYINMNPRNKKEAVHELVGSVLTLIDGVKLTPGADPD